MTHESATSRGPAALAVFLYVAGCAQPLAPGVEAEPSSAAEGIASTTRMPGVVDVYVETFQDVTITTGGSYCVFGNLPGPTAAPAREGER